MNKFVNFAMLVAMISPANTLRYIKKKLNLCGWNKTWKNWEIYDVFFKTDLSKIKSVGKLFI